MVLENLGIRVSMSTIKNLPKNIKPDYILESINDICNRLKEFI